MHALLNVAVMAARRGGNSLMRNLVKLDNLTVEQKGRNDYVSEADRAAEREVIETIHKHYPDHAILAEESGASGESDTVWIIDPLDGTTNFLHGFPVFAVSIGVQVNGRMEHGVVYDPVRQELFTASRGAGAQLDGRRIRVSGQSNLQRALIGTGFPFRRADAEMEPYLKMLGKIIRNTSGVRRPGAAALDLCYVAAGRLDGFWEAGLSAWDLAAGGLMIREAGGIVSGLDGSENYLETGHVLAGTPKIYAGLAKLCASEIKAVLHRPDAATAAKTDS
jgi:myo-inositol-1(or 4)-monophosphatase